MVDQGSVVALLASYNEERYVKECLQHLRDQGVAFYLIDNGSSDRTVEIARTFEGRGLLGVESFPRPDGIYPWLKILKRKEQLAQEIEADWFMHQDMDEFRYANRPGQSLAEAFAEVSGMGYNAVNFIEFTFVPTREDPDHNHEDFRKTLTSYYPFAKNFPTQIKAWRKQDARVDLAEPSAGHRVRFDGQVIYPESFRMMHYPYLSAEHFERKYLSRKYDEREIRRNWHSWRSRLSVEKIALPSGRDLGTASRADELSIARPKTDHVASEWAEPVQPPKAPEKTRGGGYSRRADRQNHRRTHGDRPSPQGSRLRF